MRPNKSAWTNSQDSQLLVIDRFVLLASVVPRCRMKILVRESHALHQAQPSFANQDNVLNLVPLFNHKMALVASLNFEALAQGVDLRLVPVAEGLHRLERRSNELCLQNCVLVNNYLVVESVDRE